MNMDRHCHSHAGQDLCNMYVSKLCPSNLPLDSPVLPVIQQHVCALQARSFSSLHYKISKITAQEFTSSQKNAICSIKHYLDQILYVVQTLTVEAR